MKKNYKSLVAKILTFVCVICSVLSLSAPMQAEAADNTLLNTYGAKYGYSGTCINLYQLRDANQLNALKKNFNSITLENEMKPDALLGSSARLMSVSEARSKGYYIPSNYTESTVPTINFNTVDEVMKICVQNGLSMRAHTLVWHSQTPSWFFRNGYNGGAGFVSASVMDARLEMYVKTVMRHVYSNPNGKCVYAWDVVNEYVHANDQNWKRVYGNQGTSPTFCKKAFQFAYDVLKEYNLQGKVGLFWNDYNTYMDADKEIAIINYINSNGKICNGIGMQSHCGTGFPSVDYYASALNKFIAQGYEIQITELDITNNGDTDLANYAYNLFKKINGAKKNGAKISSITWWGLSDQTTWINNAKPLLFSSPGVPKYAYSRVIAAYTETFGNGGSNPGTNYPTPGQGGSTSETTTNPTTESKAPSNPPSGVATTNVTDGWYYIKSVSSQKYLTVDGSNAGANVEIRTGNGSESQKWKVTSTGDGYFTLTSGVGNYMMDVAYGKDEDGANIGIYNAYSGEAQKYVLQKTGTEGVFTIGTKCSNGNKVLDVYQKKTADGTNIIQWTRNANSNQQFVFEAIGGQSQNTQPTTESKAPVVESKAPVAESKAPVVESKAPVVESKAPVVESKAPVVESTQPSTPSASGLKATSTVNSWGSGYQVSIKISNTGATVNTWKLTLKKSEVNITSSWNVNVKESGDSYIITPVSWNSTIPTGSTVEFGFIGTGSVGSTVTCSVK